MLIKEEIPVTEYGLNQYVRYSQKQIKESKSLITKLNNRIKACYEKAKELGIQIKSY